MSCIMSAASLHSSPSPAGLLFVSIIKLNTSLPYYAVLRPVFYRGEWTAAYRRRPRRYPPTLSPAASAMAAP